MSTSFFDTSALVKRYLVESGSAWVMRQMDPALGNTIIICEVTRVEAAAAIAARQRASGGISLADRDSAVDLLLQHCDRDYRNVRITPMILSRAVTLTQQHRLRGYDAVQLATALSVGDQYRAAGLPDLVLAATDDDLIVAARAEGFVAENPNQYP
jgi:hypothetical protein